MSLVGEDAVVTLPDAIAEVGRLWRVEVDGWSTVDDGHATTVRLPAAGVAVHISRPEVGAARVTALQAARSRLARWGIPVVELLPSASPATWEMVAGRVVEVEPWIEHDGRMNTWARLRDGAELLARVHGAWSDLDLGAAGEACDWANWISPSDVLAGCRRAAERLSAWGLGQLAADVVQLAELTSDTVTLPEQVVHGDFWDNNIYVRGEQLVAVTDFEFLGRRPRIDDLALLLYFADEQPYFTGVGARSAATRQGELAPLVHAYADALDVPLSTTELSALPYALARQPLWTFATWFLTEPDDERARRDAQVTAAAVSRALEVMAEPQRWVDAFGKAS